MNLVTYSAKQKQQHDNSKKSIQVVEHEEDDHDDHMSMLYYEEGEIQVANSVFYIQVGHLMC